MDTFENLENLQVSEACFNDIMDIVEKYINEFTPAQRADAAQKVLPQRRKEQKEAAKNFLNYEKEHLKYDPATDKLIPDDKKIYKDLQGKAVRAYYRARQAQSVVDKNGVGPKHQSRLMVKRLKNIYNN